MAASSTGWVDGGSGGTSFTPALTNEFNVYGNGASLVITLTGLPWGTSGGELILGNIHNYYEYNLSAKDSAGNPINVNNWAYLGEDLNSTSSTSYYSGGLLPPGAPSGFVPGATDSENFYVADSNASPGSGQGGVVALGDLPSTVATITLTLASNNLDNAFPLGNQGSDFIIANVGPAAVPEPSSVVLSVIGMGVVGMLVLLHRCRPGCVGSA
jgi:hypothetical protein